MPCSTSMTRELYFRFFIIMITITISISITITITITIMIMIITLFESQIILAEHECCTNWGDCKSNKSNQMLVFEK